MRLRNLRSPPLAGDRGRTLVLKDSSQGLPLTGRSGQLLPFTGFVRRTAPDWTETFGGAGRMSARVETSPSGRLIAKSLG